MKNSRALVLLAAWMLQGVSFAAVGDVAETTKGLWKASAPKGNVNPGAAIDTDLNTTFHMNAAVDNSYYQIIFTKVLMVRAVALITKSLPEFTVQCEINGWFDITDYQIKRLKNMALVVFEYPMPISGIRFTLTGGIGLISITEVYAEGYRLEE